MSEKEKSFRDFDFLLKSKKKEEKHPPFPFLQIYNRIWDKTTVSRTA